MDVVVSLQNQRVKKAVKLRDRGGRDDQQRIVIDGLREIGLALNAALQWSEAFACEEMLCDPARALLAELSAAGADIVHVSAPVFQKLAFGDRSEGVVAIAQTPVRTLPMLHLPAAPIVAVLESLEKPGNVGAILRSADAAGVSAVIVADPRTDLYNPNAIRASQGAIFTTPVAACSKDDVLAWLRVNQFRILAARIDAQIEYNDADFQPPCAIVLGSEASGLSKVWDSDDITAIRLPMRGTVDSLNVSVTAGVLFYKAMRHGDV